MLSQDIVLGTLFVGLLATAIMDLWTVFQRTVFGIPVLDFALVGRWIGHMAKGRFSHPSIATASPVTGERMLGWAAHYLIGVVFAILLLAIDGTEWLTSPSFGPALAVGICTLAFPFLVMQPAFGLGIAAARTPHPMTARMRSLVVHSCFGLGLYIAGLIWRALSSALPI